MKIGYAKIGRSMPLSPAGFGEVGGDNEPPVLLNKLARRMPEHEFVIIGRNSGEVPQDVGLPSNVTNPWTTWRPEVSAKMKEIGTDPVKTVQLLDEYTLAEWASLDAVIVWMGQHGTSNSPIPVVGGTELTNPQISFVNYASYVVRGISVWRDADPHNRQEIWLCPDPRNYLKCRDLKWPPPPIMCQFDWSKKEKHYRYGDPTDPGFFNATWAEDNVWQATHTYEYQELENVGIPTSTGIERGFADRTRFGVLINEARTGVKNSRVDVARQWIMPASPDWMAGKWSQPSIKKLGFTVAPIPWHTVFSTLGTVKSSFTTPSSGSGWATTKPWECFAVGTICFFHPGYDTQDHILGRPGFEELRRWLRVDTPESLKKRVDAVNSSEETWSWLAAEQRRLYDAAMLEQRCITEIMRRIGA
jgi:hypothetical protein